MQIFLDKFHQGVKYTAQIAIQQAWLRIEGKFPDQKSLYIISLQNDYLNLDRSSGSGINNLEIKYCSCKINFLRRY